MTDPDGPAKETPRRYRNPPIEHRFRKGDVGAFLAPLICGTLGEELGWHYGFAAAGVGMTIALVVYLYAVPMLPPDETHKAKAAGLATRPQRMARRPRANHVVSADHDVLGYVRAAEQHDRAVGRRAYRPHHRSHYLARRDPRDPVPGLQPFHELHFHAFRYWVLGVAGEARNGAVDRQQVALGCFGVALSYLIMAGAAWSADGDTATWWWLMGLVAVRVSVHTSQVLNACDLSGHIFAFLVPV